tara:strand:+ start:19686 stop:20126 length:441 start_codon:yes stop_codon:yes gene_type:complete
MHVTVVTPEVRHEIIRMLTAMHMNNGIGLAAPQLGIAKRIIVINMDLIEDKPAKMEGNAVFIDPYITVKEGDTYLHKEQCLSIPGVTVEVPRYPEVKVAYTNLEGRREFIVARGLFAAVLQHEIDHIEGKLIIDYLNKGRPVDFLD